MRSLCADKFAGTRTALDWFLWRQRADVIAWRDFVVAICGLGRGFADGSATAGKKMAGSAAMTLQFVEALRYGAELERAFGDVAVAEKYERAAARAAEGGANEVLE